jgi:hypothetical protein
MLPLRASALEKPRESGMFRGSLKDHASISVGVVWNELAVCACASLLPEPSL